MIKISRNFNRDQLKYYYIFGSIFRYYVIQGETKIKYILKRQSYDILCSIFFFGIQKPENITSSYPAEHQYCPYCHSVSVHTSEASGNGGINTQGLHFHWNKHLSFSILHLNKIFLSQVLLLYKSNNSYYSFESILKTGNGNNKYHLS